MSDDDKQKTEGIEQKADRENPRFMLYVLKSPHAGQGLELYNATQQRLVNDLHELDEAGWEIAFIMPDAAHVLMKRKADWSPPPSDEKARKKKT